MCALYPATDALPGIADTGLDAFLERTSREATPLIRLGLWLATWIFTVTPLFTVGWPLPSFLLPTATRERHASKICSHPIYLIRQSVFVLKMMAGLCWGAHPKVREVMNLPAYPADPGTWRTS